MTYYETVSEAVNGLLKRGYKENFNIKGYKNDLMLSNYPTKLPANDFRIDEVHRFEGLTDPGDEMIVFAISSDSLGLKCILVNAYGMYSESIAAELVQNLLTHS